MNLTKYLKLILVLVLFIGMSYHTSASITKEYISDKKDTKDLIKNGCVILDQKKHLDLLQCDSNLALSLGLQENIQIHKMDSGANSQIGAGYVHDTGNLGQTRKIVVLDTGYNYNHPELSSSYLGGYDFINNDNDPFDDNGHGSFVAGIITSDGINSASKGAAPDTGIISGKILDSSGNGNLFNLINQIYWAVDGPDGIYGTSDDFNADAIVSSLGTSAPYIYTSYCDDMLPELTDAVNYASSRNVALVAAAGNYGTSGVSIPGCISGAITVGSVDYSNKIESTSGRGQSIDIVAPGVNLLSTYLGTSYVTGSGTSAAAPIVAGTISLIKYAHPNYDINQIKAVLTSTALDLGAKGFDNTYGYGLINARSSVSYTFPQCSDNIDNDLDGYIDLLDADCLSALDNKESTDTQPHYIGGSPVFRKVKITQI